KSQAQAEKDKLAEAEKAKQAAKAASPGGGGGGPGGREMPPADFRSLVGTLVTQALMYLGGFPDPETGRAIVSLEYPSLYIDLLGVLETKTKGNLTAEESSDLTQALNELRLRFVEISQMMAEMAKQRAAGGGAGGGAGGLGGAGMGLGGMPPTLRP